VGRAHRDASADLSIGACPARHGPGRPPPSTGSETKEHPAHTDRARTGTTDWTALRTLYDALHLVAPTMGVQVARAAVVARLDGPAAGLADSASAFQAFWATRAHLLAEAGDLTAARAAFDRAIELTSDPAVRSYLQNRRPPG
jgi:RNA polymerase sigma-70 factor (ECF subfamily)